MMFLWRMLPIAAAVVATAALGIAASGFAAFYYLRPALPSVAEMREIPLQIPLRIYTRDGRLMQVVGEKRRNPVAYNEIPEIVVAAFLAAEDDRFFEHPGFDYQGILRAAINLALTGSKAQGGSTITQQLAREYFLNRDRTFIRKAKELILAIQIENAFGKQEILALYLNKIFLGQRAYGVAAAAQVYFGKMLGELSVAEAATIAGLPAAPSRLNPVSSAAQARDRRSYVLRRMLELNFIDDETYETALSTPMESFLHAPRVDLEAPYVAEMVRSEMLRRYGQSAYTDGFQVITTLDSELQRAAVRALRTALLQYDRRHGFRGAIAHADPVQIESEYLARLMAEAGEHNAPDDPGGEAALQEYLSSYPRFSKLRAAIVTATDTDNSASFFLRDTGLIILPWERISWRRHINDDVIGDKAEQISELLAVGDVVYLLDTANGWQLAQVPEAQGAFVALNPRDGATVALTGGFDYASSKFNRAVQTKRQPGSSFKPFIYSAALENGYTASSIINDAPIVVNNTGQEEAWRPENHSNRFYGPTRIREGLVRSMNLVSLRLLRGMGVGNALAHLQPFGFPKTATPRNLSLALGSGGASPMAMARGYTSFASGGYSLDNYIIDRILDAQGNVLYQAEPDMVCTQCKTHWFDGRESLQFKALPDFARQPSTEGKGANDARDDSGDDDDTTDIDLGPAKAPLSDGEIPEYASETDMIAQALNWQPDYTETPQFWSDRNQANRIVSAQNAYIVYDMMRDVIRHGTGRRARELGRRDIAGKTGTSNNRRDAWFSGYNADLVGIAWVGFDDDARSLGAGEEGSRTALPIWKDFMAVALEGSADAALEQPEGIVTVRISRTTGMATISSDDAIFELFRAGNEPILSESQVEFDDEGVFVGDDSAENIF